MLIFKKVDREIGQVLVKTTGRTLQIKFNNENPLTLRDNY